MTFEQPMHVKNMNPWALVTCALVGFIVGYGAHAAVTGGALNVTPPAKIAQAPTPTPTPPPTTGTPPKIDNDDPVLGDEDAPVTLVEFTYYQCPFCARFFTQTMGQIKTTYVDTGKVKMITKDFPLSFHSNAQKASEATECAGDQDKFWEMHDTLFEKQAAWSSSTDGIAVFTGYAKELGLNEAKFKKCLDDGTKAAETQADMAAGQAAGISGTPGFWIIGKDGKGQMLSGAQPFTAFQAAIDAQLAK